MKTTLQDIKVEYYRPILIIYDNTSAIKISNNIVMHSKMNHIPIKCHILGEQVAELSVNMEYIATKEQVAYNFTKPLPIEIFEYLRQNLRVISFSCC
jgi:capsule polysaccharide export protein KpsC/LpsZ